MTIDNPSFSGAPAPTPLDGQRIRREVHARFTVPAIDFQRWVIERAGLNGTERILDVGSGDGVYHASLTALHPTIRYHAIDHTIDGLHLQTDAQRVCGDILDLPYADESFDVVMANHMLFLVESIDAAINELRRVLTPDGILITATNSRDTMPQIRDLLHRGVMLMGQPGHPTPRSPRAAVLVNNYSLESGLLRLARQFRSVVRYDLPGVLRFHDAQPLMAYIESLRFFREPQLPSYIHWDEVMHIVRDQVERIIGHIGVFDVEKVSGVLIASDSGGFIREFHEHRIAGG